MIVKPEIGERLSRATPEGTYDLTENVVQQFRTMVAGITCSHNETGFGSRDRARYSGSSFVYVVHAKAAGVLKIGSTIDPYKLGSRFRQLQSMSPVELELIALGRGRVDTESNWHWNFKRYRKHCEWFDDSIAETFINAMRTRPKNGCARCVLGDYGNGTNRNGF